MSKLKDVYVEDTIDEFGVSHTWTNTTVLNRFVTEKGTVLEMIKRPNWGIACYMDNSIQSCEVDEKIYHEALVHPIMFACQDNCENVCIIGGGEGATAREVLRWSSVKSVDMYDWDADVVNLFRTSYPQWAKGAWEDPRLTIHYVDIFERIQTSPPKKYDIIIIDLFDPDKSNMGKWSILLESLQYWIKDSGSIVMYAGMRALPGKEQPYISLQRIIHYHTNNYSIQLGDCSIEKDVIPYKVYIPSFSGESTFLLIKDGKTNVPYSLYPIASISSHITKPVWESYKTMNY